MKKSTLILTVPIMLATLATASCQKEDITPSDDNHGQPVSMDTIVQPCDSDFVNSVLGMFLNGMEGTEGIRDTIAAFLKDYSYDIDENGNKGQMSESRQAFYNLGKYSTATLKYRSVDGNGQSIVLSARLAWNSETKRTIQGIVVHMHETMFGNDEAPSVYKSNFMERLAIDDNLVVIPDYIGFGESASQRQTYLSHELIARNCLDAVIAAINACKDTQNWPNLPHNFASDYGTYITGYSQGGANGLALHKYIETKATQQERNMVNLKHSFIGSGPYNPVETFNKWLEDGRMTLPVLLPLCIDGMQAGGDSNLNGFDMSGCFTRTFNSCGFLQDIHDKKKGLMDIYIDVIAKLRQYSSRDSDQGEVMPYFSLDAILSQDGLDPNSNIRKRIGKALANQNLLADDWTPSAPITFFYTSKDDVVPPRNTELAYEKWEKSGKVKIIDCNVNNHLVAWIPFEIYAVRFDLYKGYKNIQRNAELKFLIYEMTNALKDVFLNLY